MRGPAPHGPTVARRLTYAAKVAVSVVMLLVAILAIEGWKALERRAGIPVGPRGSARLVPLPPVTPAAQQAREASAARATRETLAVRETPAARDGATIEQAIAASAFVVVDLSTGRAIREQKAERLDAAVWPGSIAKLATFAAAIDAGALTDATRVMCTRQLTLPGGRRVDCSHPPIGHPLSPVEALANSCNVFTATIARGLTREQLSSGFVRLGLSPVPPGVDIITSAFGLGGAQVAPRKLIEAVRRAANIPLIREGLRLSARAGTSSAFGDAGIDALAKTGTAPMKSGGRALGLVAALTPADTPRYGIVVALPGASGAQAAEIAAAILRSIAPRGAAAGKTANGPALSLWTLAREQDRARPSSAAPAVVRMRIGQPTAKGYAVETLDVEEYVARVVAGETSDATPAAAREALAITARTFAMVNRGRHAGDGFDLCTLTHCQVTRPVTRSSRAAADRTRGQVLVDVRGDSGRGDGGDRGERDGGNTRLAPVFYSASCGGMLADARALLPNADAASMPWLASRPDPAGVEEVAWQTEIPAGDLLRALQQNGSRGDALRNLIAHGGGGTSAASGGRGASGENNRVPTPSTPANLGRGRAASSERGAGSVITPSAGPGLVTHITTEGLTPSTLAIDDFRRAVGQHLGWQLLKSTRFTVQRTSRGYRFTGRGHGHGVGLCVLGASALAARGDDAPRILQAYFPGLQVTTPSTRGLIPLLRTSRAATATAGAATAAASDAVPLPAIQLRLPSRDEGERARLMRLISTNLKELALDLSLPSPASLDVVVHPTIEAYRRATRSPAWTSAATILAGDDITLHFAPLSEIDRGAMLTQTVRHELVHVLTLRALFERPRWVHEGLALHFAGERVSAGPEEASNDRVKCPSDRDLMRPHSRDAFDHAYSRAAACVARDLASGRNWRDLGAR